MLGFYENFSQTIHETETYAASISKKKLQQKIVKVFEEINRETLGFEDIGNPTVPSCTVIFEFGIASEGNFNYLNAKEATRLQKTVNTGQLHVLDWFCSIRYYKNKNGKRAPLKFDYFMLRMNFGEKGAMEISVFHERGPRYVSPEDLVYFIERRINQTTPKKIIKRNN